MLRAGCDRCPNAFAPTAAPFATGALRYAAIDHDKANRLLRQVVSRFDARSGNESNVVLAVIIKAFREILCLFDSRHASDGLQPYSVPLIFQRVAECLLGLVFVAAMNDCKQFA